MKIITEDKLVINYDCRHSPVESIEPGEIFKIRTHNRNKSFLNLSQLATDYNDPFSKLFCVSGPVYINGAQPNQTLEIEILDIIMSEKTAVITQTPGKGGFRDKIREARAKLVELDSQYAYFNKGIKIPLRRHIGKIATMPSGEPVSTSIPGMHGGNMDNREITVGSIVYLPIFVEGALLTVGDIHACMGDGEANSTGLEATAEVTLRCNVIDQNYCQRPMVKTDKEIMIMTEAPKIDEAIFLALDEMAGLLQKSLKLDYGDAALLISATGDLRICQITNPLVGIRIVMPRSIIDFPVI